MDGYFVFDDVNSADYKIWVKAGGTYGAAARRYTSEVVPGRNGALTIDDGAYEEKEHPYECHIGDDFPENIEAFRNAIMAKVGRFVLSDSYHPDEFYRALYMRGLEPDVAALAKAGAFTLTFTRDPRRFLVSGDTPQDVSVTTETLSGTSVSFDNATGADRITGLSVSVMAAQEGIGDPSPTNVRPVTGWDGANIVNNEAAYPVTWGDAGTVYGGTLDVTNGTLTVEYAIINIDGSKTVSMTSAGHFFYSIGSMAIPPNARGEQSTGWCSHYRLVSNITSSEFSALDNVTAYNNISMSGSNGRAFFNDSRFSTGADFKSYLVAQNEAGTPVQYIYKLATPVIYQLIPAAVATFAGENNIWADCGDVTVTLLRPGEGIVNPTRFTAQPLIRVYGQGRVDVGSVAITVTGSYPYVDIDAEMGDCYYNGANANSAVSFSGGYPKLLPGKNYITFSGVTKVEITPRWWRL